MHKPSSFSQFHYRDCIAQQNTTRRSIMEYPTLSRALAEQPRRGQASSFKHHIVQMVEHLEYTMAQAT